MVEIRNKKTNELIGSGEIIKEDNETIKIHTSNRIYKKKNVIVDYIILVVVIMLSACSSHKKYSKEKLNKIYKRDSIINQIKTSRVLDYNEEIEMFEDRDINIIN